VIRSNRAREETSIIRHSNNNPTVDTVTQAGERMLREAGKKIAMELRVRPSHQEPRDDQGMVTLNCGAVRRLISRAYPQLCVPLSRTTVIEIIEIRIKPDWIVLYVVNRVDADIAKEVPAKHHRAVRLVGTKQADKFWRQLHGRDIWGTFLGKFNPYFVPLIPLR
jgi:hypothetical protein